MSQKRNNAGSALVKTNTLIRRPTGVYRKDEMEPFFYTDSTESERHLRQVLENAADLSSTSTELESAILDWPSEYHLSSKRANLLRGLNLSSGLNVLELGCGCGAITRYLGDQGFQVDAIEGSGIRAELAGLRCRGLENVNIVCSNFYELQYPEGAYDVVLLIDVADFAARYLPQPATSEEAVVNLLRSAKRCLRENGVVVAAVENRTGMKYVFGAHEDHLSKRYVGIHDYPDQSGIKTYTQNEWAALIDNAGFIASKYLLPFPDYKVPTVQLSAEYAVQSSHAYAHLEGLMSRDYLMILDLDAQEPIFWESTSANGTLPKFANSYLILMGDYAATLEQIAAYDFVHFPDFKRKPQYWVITSKQAGSNTVEHQRLSTEAAADSGELSQQLQSERFIQGNLLSIDWSRALLIEPWGSRFKQYLAEFYDYLNNTTLCIDLVPTNIIVGGDDTYHHFDQEWQVEWELSPNYLLFRALLLFAVRHRPTLREFARLQSLNNIRELIQFCFNELRIDTKEEMAGYIAREEHFQQLVNRAAAAGSIKEQLEIRINQPALEGPVSAKVYWKRAGDEHRDYSEEDSMSIHAFPDNESARLVFELPAAVRNLSRIRFDPTDERTMRDIGFLRIPYVRVEASHGDGKEEILLIEGSENVASRGALSGIVYNQGSYGETFAVVRDNPEIEFELNIPDSGQVRDNYKIEIDCSLVRSTEYKLVQDRFLIKEDTLTKRLKHVELEHEYFRVKNEHLQQEIELMKASKAWKLVQCMRSISGRGGE